MTAPGFRVTDSGVEVATCKGCPNETIYVGGFCSDCRIDMQLGEVPGTFYRQEYGDQPAGGDPR
jgi:hypothetical protein